MRIIAGQWRGRSLAAPEGLQTRPTSDRAREGLFSMLASRIGTFEGLRVADLFAGTGALGIEALSRGAGHCLFVDSDRQAAGAIARNLRTLGASDRADVRQQPVEHSPAPLRPFDILLMDPPYRSPPAPETMARLASPDWLAPGGWMSVEVGGQAPPIPDELEIETERRFGRAAILLLRRAA